MNRFLSLLLVVPWLAAQTSNPVKTTFTTAPQSTVSFESADPDLPASAIQLCSIGTVTVTRTSATVLTLADGAAATTPQYVRITPRTRKLTAERTLTISSGSGAGTVEIWGYIVPSTGAFEWRVINFTSNTLAISGDGTVVANTSILAQETRAAGVLVQSWQTNIGNWAAAYTYDYQTAKDCWVDFLSVANKTAAPVAVTVTDGQGTPVNVLPATVIQPNSAWILSVDGGIYFESGVKITAGAAESLDVKIRGGKRQ